MRKILFHSYGSKHCVDGFGAAYAAYKTFGDNAQYIGVTHLTKEDYAARVNLPEINKGDEVYILDFAYPQEILEEWMDKGAVIVLLDHHKGNQESLINLSIVKGELDTFFDDDASKAYFDLNKSGAQLAWEYFNPDKPTPDLIKYIADRDLWRKALPYTEEVHRALSTFPQDFEVWDTLANLPNYVSFMRKIGEPIWQAHCKEVDDLIKTATWKNLLGYQVLATNTSNYSLVSDALNKICRENPDTPFAVNYRIVDGKMKFELRSVGDFNVQQIAKQIGGGGHHNAAGALVELIEKNHDLIKDFLL